MKKFLFITFLASGVLLGVEARAAEPHFYIEFLPSEAAPGSIVTAAILLDSIDPLNAFSVELVFPLNALSVESFDNSRSIIDIWQKQPVVNEHGEVKLVGGSFKAFTGKRGELITIRFKALQEGRPTVSFKSAEAYLADGKGTRANVSLGEGILVISKSANYAAATEVADDIPPEIANFSLEQDPFNANQQLLSFVVKDKESGIKNIEARYRTWFTWTSWQPVANPVAVPKSAWSVSFRVADNRQNLTAQVIYHWPTFFKNLMPVFLVLLGLLLLFSLKGRKRQLTR